MGCVAKLPSKNRTRYVIICCIIITLLLFPSFSLSYISHAQPPPTMSYKAIKFLALEMLMEYTFLPSEHLPFTEGELLTFMRYVRNLQPERKVNVSENPEIYNILKKYFEKKELIEQYKACLSDKPIKYYTPCVCDGDFFIKGATESLEGASVLSYCCDNKISAAPCSSPSSSSPVSSGSSPSSSSPVSSGSSPSSSSPVSSGSSPSSSTSLAYFGFAFAVYGNTNYIKDFGTFSNVAVIASSVPEIDSLQGVQQLADLDIQRIKEAALYGMKSIVMVNPVFFKYTFDNSGKLINFELYPDYQRRWDLYSQKIKPFKDDILGFYIIDEPYWCAIVSGMSFKNVYDMIQTAALTVKRTFPNAKTLATIPITADDLKQETYLGYRIPANALKEYAIPTSLDWIGIDYYYKHVFNPTLSQYKQIFNDKYIANLMRYKTSSQKIYLVPQAFSLLSNPVSETELVNLADFYYQYALTHKEIVGIFPFTYGSFLGEGTENIKGTEYMPLLKAKYQEIGRMIIGATNPTKKPETYNTPSTSENSDLQSLIPSYLIKQKPFYLLRYSPTNSNKGTSSNPYIPGDETVFAVVMNNMDPYKVQIKYRYGLVNGKTVSGEGKVPYLLDGAECSKGVCKAKGIWDEKSLCSSYYGEKPGLREFFAEAEVASNPSLNDKIYWWAYCRDIYSDSKTTNPEPTSSSAGSENEHAEEPSSKKQCLFYFDGSQLQKISQPVYDLFAGRILNEITAASNFNNLFYFCDTEGNLFLYIVGFRFNLKTTAAKFFGSSLSSLDALYVAQNGHWYAVKKPNIIELDSSRKFVSSHSITSTLQSLGFKPPLSSSQIDAITFYKDTFWIADNLHQRLLYYNVGLKREGSLSYSNFPFSRIDAMFTSKDFIYFFADCGS